MSKSILITGGTGFIGYHLAKKCLKKGWNVTSLSSSYPKKRVRLKNVSYLICDISKKSELKKIKNYQYDYVVNLDVSEKEVIKRLTARGRADDKPEIIKNRIKVYHRETAPLLKYYKDEIINIKEKKP